ncbi:MAG: hypothetical protein QW828_00420 [Candidatus Bathyarchaeia archaeon]
MQKKSNVDKEELTRSVLAALLLVTVVVGALLWPSLTPKESTRAVALLIHAPRTITTGTQQDILVEAVNSSGAVDLTRNDTVKISLNSGAARIRCKFCPDRTWSKEVTLNLDQGMARIEFFGPQRERIVINATWLSGESPLTSTSITTYLLQFHPEETEFPP